MEQLENRVGVVTGAASGIGLGIARAFAAAGMKVVLADMREPELARAADELRHAGADVIGLRTDVTVLEDVQTLADSALETFGAVHVLCNNAGVSRFSPLAQTTIHDWRWMLDVDLWGPIHGVMTFLPIIERAEEGHICSTSSMAGLVAVPRLGAYSAAKHAVVGLMSALERELRAEQSSVHASVLCPGRVNTDILVTSADYRSRYAGAEGHDDLRRSIEGGIDPDDVGGLVLDAIRNDRFWIFTDAESKAAVERQFADVIADQSLTGYPVP